MDGYGAVVVECTEKIDQLKDYLAGGRVQSYEEYKHTVGVIRGLTFAVELLKDREQKLKDSNE